MRDRPEQHITQQFLVISVHVEWISRELSIFWFWCFCFAEYCKWMKFPLLHKQANNITLTFWSSGFV